jgi:hypothetical protein
MFSFDRLEIDKIPIGENRRRIKYLSDYRDLLNTAFGWSVRTGWQPSYLEERRTAINEGKPLVHRMITLSGIKTVRQCARSDIIKTEGLDVLDEIWSLERLHISTREPITAIEEAIGEYKRDRKRAWWRTWNPFFWIAHIIEWIAELPVRLFGVIFGVDQKKAVSSPLGRSATIFFNATIWIFALVQTLAALGLLGWWRSLLQWISHH